LKADEIRTHQGSPQTISEEKFDEVISALKAEINSDDKFKKVIKVLQSIFKNIHTDPTNPKFWKLKLSNGTIRDSISNVEASQMLVEMMGFKRQHLSNEKGELEDCYMFQILNFQLD